MSNTITIELCAEDRARLDHINVNLTELIMRVMGEVTQKAAPELAEKLAVQHPVADPFKELPKAEPVPFEQEAPKQEAPQYKLEDIQQKVVALSASGKKAEVREIVKSYAEKVSAIPADKFGEVMAKLIGLEG